MDPSSGVWRRRAGRKTGTDGWQGTYRKGEPTGGSRWADRSLSTGADRLSIGFRGFRAVGVMRPSAQLFSGSFRRVCAALISLVMAACSSPAVTPTATSAPAESSAASSAPHPATAWPIVAGRPPPAPCPPPAAPSVATPRPAPAGAGALESWQIVGQVGGAMRAGAAQGTDIYVGVGERLTVVDASGPLAPHEVGASAPLGGAVSGISLNAGLAYVAAGEAGLRILDVRDRAKPTVLGRWKDEG